MTATGAGQHDAPDKADLRARIRTQRRQRRRARPNASTREESARIARAAIAHLDSCPAARAAGWGTDAATVAVFRSTPSEPDTGGLIAALHERGVRVLVPRTLTDLSLDWHVLHPSATEPSDSGLGAGPQSAGGAAAAATVDEDVPDSKDSAAELPTSDDVADEGPSLGVDAIADITAMILPGLAVDALGHRLGQGGGCYDRTLPRMRPDTCRAVLLFDDEILGCVPHGEHDRVVPAMLTPDRGWLPLG